MAPSKTRTSSHMIHGWRIIITNETTDVRRMILDALERDADCAEHWVATDPRRPECRVPW